MQSTGNQANDEHSVQRQLIDRLRFILAVIASMAAVFVVDELINANHPPGAFLAFRVSGAALALLGFFVLRQRWAEGCRNRSRLFRETSR